MCTVIQAYDSSTNGALSPSSVEAAGALRDPSNGSSASVAPAASAEVKAAVADGACPAALFPPRPPASPAQLASARATGFVQPLYTGSPAPIGLADYGLSILPNGTHVASVLDTTSLRGQVDANASGVQPLDLYNSEFGPDAYSLQMNAVLTKVVLFGQARYEFWTQNVMEYYPSAHELFLITNVWNFTGPLLYGLGNAIYAHSPNGTNFGVVYEAAVGFANITYPFDLTLYLNSTVTGGRDAVYFTGDLSGPHESIRAPFDYVVFNSINDGGSPVSSPALYSANGTGYDPLGLTNDFELDFGGPGDGSQATLLAADANLSLAYWDPVGHGGGGGYVAVPSAYNYGGETGETSTGATVTWSDAPGGPGGVGAWGVMRTGPSILAGLWNASGPEGAYPVTIDSAPSNAFQLVTPVVRSPWTDLTPGLSVSPSARANLATAYDPALGGLVMFGGYSPVYGGLQDTWEFAHGKWTLLSSGNGSGANTSNTPAARWGASLVYDAADGYLVLFGGRTGSVEVLNDTWIFNATGWHEIHSTHSPSARAFASMAYDPAESEVILYGGGVGTGDTPWTLYDDTWAFRGGEWTNISSTAGTPPPARIKGEMTYDPSTGALLMVGGALATVILACPYTFTDEWTFSNGQWTELTPTGAVPPAGDGALWYDNATGTTYLYRGIENLMPDGGSCWTLSGDVFAYHAGLWTLVYAGLQSGAPPPRGVPFLVDDVAANLQVLFGGAATSNGPFYSDTWAFNPNAARGPPAPQVVEETYVGLTVTTHTFWLAPGNYSLVTELAGYDPVTTALNVTGPLTVAPTLPKNASTGIYTPLWAWSNSQFAAISTAGAGTPTDPYVLENGPSELIGSAFGLYNDYAFPVYPGMFLLETTASVEVLSPPPFVTATNDFQPPGPELPQFNSLPLWFWDVSGVVLTGGVDIGLDVTWSSELGPFAVAFYDSTHNLVYRNSFDAPAAAVLFQFGPGPAPYTGPSGDNTVWGNTFGAYVHQGEIGVVEDEPNDLIYNNKFLNAVTACSAGNPALNICWPNYSFVPVGFFDEWNITPQPASNTHFASGFPGFPLTGSVIGTTEQGGNYWWNYGLPPNSYGLLPYDERVYGNFSYISPGGDYAPLVVPTSVTFFEYGLTDRALAKHGWTVVLNGAVQHSTSEELKFSPVFPGNLSLLVLGPPGFRTGASGSLNVSTTNATLGVKFVRGATYSLSVAEKGLGAGRRWCPAVDGFEQCSRSRSVRFSGLSSGIYNVSVAHPSTHGLNVSSEMFGAPVNLTAVPVFESERLRINFTYPVLFREVGLPSDTVWQVKVGRLVGYAFVFGGSSSTIELNLTNGTYSFRAMSSDANYVLTGARRAVVDGATTVTVTFRLKGS